jgi:VCBS repeat-containing protein
MTEDSFTYVAIDEADHRSLQATVWVTIMPVNDNDPVAADDAFTVAEEELFVSTQDLLDILLDAITVLANDTDLDLPADSLRVVGVTNPAHGELVVMNEDGTFTYKHDDSETLEDFFTYVVEDDAGHQATATVYITILPVNDPLVANDDTATTDEDTPVSVLDSGALSVLDNDEDPEAGSLTVVTVNGEEGNVGVMITLPSGALLTLNADGTFLYDPNGWFEYLQVDETATDTFTYRASDGEYLSNVATVTVTITGVNDAPETNVPEPPPGPPDGPVPPDGPGPGDGSYTVVDSATVIRGETVEILDNGETSVLANDFDVEGDPLTAVLVDGPRHVTAFILNADGTFSYTHDGSETTTDVFTYQAYDGDLYSVVTPVTITILPKKEGTKESERNVIISEIAWAGTAADPRDEWIELRNLGQTEVDLTGWTLCWKPKEPKASDEGSWVVIELAGTIGPAPSDSSESSLPIRFVKRETDDISWWVVNGLSKEDRSYFTLERRQETTVSDVTAGLVYDTKEPYVMELPDSGAVMELVNAKGVVVDTANADHPEQAGWLAGDAATRATMERSDPRGPDIATNWHTNLGIITHGQDAEEQGLVATAGTANSVDLSALALFVPLEPIAATGESIKVSLDLSNEGENGTVHGWPWVHVAQLAGGVAVGEEPQGEVEVSVSGYFDVNQQYWLEIDTSNLPPGEYQFWIVYGDGKVILVPVLAML